MHVCSTAIKVRPVIFRATGDQQEVVLYSIGFERSWRLFIPVHRDIFRSLVELHCLE